MCACVAFMGLVTTGRKRRDEGHRRLRRDEEQGDGGGEGQTGRLQTAFNDHQLSPPTTFSVSSSSHRHIVASGSNDPACLRYTHTLLMFQHILIDCNKMHRRCEVNRFK